jgi:preprotein translocase subunit SecG
MKYKALSPNGKIPFDSIAQILRFMLVIGLSVQVVLGMLWLIFNISVVPDFEQTGLGLQQSYEGWWLSFLVNPYDLLAAFLYRLTGYRELWYAIFLYTIQLTIAWLGGYRLLRVLCVMFESKRTFKRLDWYARLWRADGSKFESKGTFKRLDWYARLWRVDGSKYAKIGAFCVLFIPMTLQCHLAVLPESLASSFFLFSCAEAFAGRETFHPFQALSFWVISIWILPAYALLGIPVVLFVLARVFLHLRGARGLRASSLLVIVLFGLFLGFWKVELGYENGINGFSLSVSQATLSRVSWPVFEKVLPYLPSQVKEVVSAQDIRLIHERPEEITQILVPELVDKVGQEETIRLLYDTAKICLDYHTKQVVGQILTDIVSYMITPVALVWQLSGEGTESFGGQNYARMKAQAPGITKIFVWYTFCWFVLGIVVTVLLHLLNTFCMNQQKSSDKTYKWKIALFCTCVATSLCVAVVYTLQGASMMDYKKGIIPTLLWYVGMIVVLRKGVRI